MKGGLNKKISINRQSIVSLLLFVFCSLLLGEGLHTHKPFQDQQFSVSSSPDGAVVKHPQSFCKFCDYLVHHNHSLTPVSYHITAVSAQIIFVAEFVPVKFVYTFGDLLLFSGNSPPVA